MLRSWLLKANHLFMPPPSSAPPRRTARTETPCPASRRSRPTLVEVLDPTDFGSAEPGFLPLTVLSDPMQRLRGLSPSSGSGPGRVGLSATVTVD
jgi:hypothetical protein